MRDCFAPFIHTKPLGPSSTGRCAVAVRLSEVIDAHRDKSEQTTVLGEDFDDGADAIPRADRTASFLCLLDLPLDVPRLVSSNDDADGIATETSPALIAAPGTCGSLLIVRTAPYTSGCTAVQPYQRRDARNRTSMWSSPEWVEQGTVRKNMTVKPPPSPLYLTRTQTRTHTRPACRDCVRRRLTRKRCRGGQRCKTIACSIQHLALPTLVAAVALGRR